VTIHQQHVGSDSVAADLHMVRERREDPDAPATMEAAGGLEMQLATQQLVDKPERLLVLNDAVIRSCG
jgi:hypothetical protein